VRKAVDILAGVRVGEDKIFLVERYENEPRKIFYRINFTKKVPRNTFVTVAGKQIPFFSLFKLVVERTGKHDPSGVLLSSLKNMPDHLMNYELASFLREQFNKKDSGLVTEGHLVS
jgi:hypothetical protein